MSDTAADATTSDVPAKRGLWARWVVRPVKVQLTQGLSVPQAARAIAYGLTLGIFPIIGATTLLTLAVGLPLRLNQPILQAFKTVAIPLQWATILGFYRLGEWVFQVTPVSLSIPVMLDEFAAAPGAFFLKYGLTALRGVCVWMLMAPLLVILIQRFSQPLLAQMARTLQPNQR